MYTVVALSEVDVDLTVFAIILLLAAHPTVAHLQALLDTSSLDPWLAANFDTQLGFQVFGKLVPPSNSSFVSVARQYAASIRKVIPHFQY
jgi:hypothetical protein